MGTYVSQWPPRHIALLLPVGFWQEFKGRSSGVHQLDADVVHESSETGVKTEKGGSLYMFVEFGEKGRLFF
jgi:hypothetical protein